MKLIFLGIQGSGKSTQAKLAAEKLAVPYIEMGQLLRARSKDTDKDALEIKRALEIGNLVPDYITVKVLKDRLKKADCLGGYVLDGYPRNYAQLEGMPPDIDKVFYIKIPDEVGLKRLITRAREDDTLDVITRRMHLFHQVTEPLLAYFKQKQILVEIDGQRSVEEIHQDIMKIIEGEIARNF